MPWEPIITALVTVACGMQAYNWQRQSEIEKKFFSLLERLETKIDQKMDETDCTSKVQACHEARNSARDARIAAIGDRVLLLDQGFSGHSHEGLERASRVIIAKQA